jgi:glycosyltransferase involved in cell wall biosynthesis
VGSVIAYRVLSPLLDGAIRRGWIARARHAAALTRNAADELTDIGLRSVDVIPHGASAATPDAPPPSGGRHVLLAGFLGHSKGTDVLLRAWAQVGASSALPLRIAGRLTEDHAVEIADARRAADASGNPPAFLGEVLGERSFQRLFAEASIVVIPYRTSSPASGIVVRAMTEGRCIVATRVPATHALLKDEVNALLVEPGDEDQLALALRRVLGDDALRDRLGAAAGRTGARLSWDATAAALEDIYRDIVRSEASTSA